MDYLSIRPMYATDLSSGFLETLSILSPIGNPTIVKLGDAWRKRANQGVLTFVAVVEERIVGTASLQMQQKFSHNCGFTGYIEDVAVLPAYQNSGVGKRLINYLIEICKSRNCYKIILNCKPELISYYEKFGFKNNGAYMRIDLDS